MKYLAKFYHPASRLIAWRTLNATSLHEAELIARGNLLCTLKGYNVLSVTEIKPKEELC